MWLTIAGQCNEGHLFETGLSDGATGDEATRVGKQHHLEQHRGWIGRGSGEVVTEAGIEMREVNLVIEKMVQSMLEGASDQLLFQHDGQQSLAAPLHVQCPYSSSVSFHPPR